MPVSLHGEPDIGAGFAAGDLTGAERGDRGLDGEDAAVGHRVTRVEREVQQDLFHLCCVGADQADPWREAQHAFDARPEQAPEQRRGADDDVVEVQRARLRLLVAPDRQQVRGEIGGVLARFADLAGVAQGRGRMRQRLDQGVAPAHDRRQHVVEVVRDAGGEVADRRRFLRLLQLPFELAPLGDVAGEEQLATDAAGVDEAGGRRLHHPPPAVAAADAELHRRIGPGPGRRGAHGVEPALGVGAVVGMDELEGRQAEAFARRIAERPLGGRRDRGDGVRGIEYRDDVGDLFDDVLQRRRVIDTPRRSRSPRWRISGGGQDWVALIRAMRAGNDVGTRPQQTEQIADHPIPGADAASGRLCTATIPLASSGRNHRQCRKSQCKKGLGAVDALRPED